MKRSQPIAVPRTPRCAEGLPVVDGESEHRGKSACDDSQSVPSRHDNKECDKDNDPALTNDHSVACDKTQEKGAPVGSQLQERYAQNDQSGCQGIGHDDMGVDEHKLARRCNHYRQKGRIPTSEGIRSPASCEHERHRQEPCSECDIAGIAADKPKRRQDQRGAGLESRRVHDLLCVGRIGIVPHCRGVAVPVGETVGRIEVLVSVGEWLGGQGKGLVEEQQRGRNERQRTEATQNDEPNRMILPGRRQLPKWQRQPARLRPNLHRSHYCVFKTQDPASTEGSVGRPVRVSGRQSHTVRADVLPARNSHYSDQDRGASCGCRGPESLRRRWGGLGNGERSTAERSLDTFARGSCMRSVRGHLQHGSRRSVVGHP